ncbi:hypothetical protein [Parashewanella tropica]|uniref:hypothetical protein n=1 Tax=Parashewanella tropica TaxID=2547970 RepID=UPI00105A429B|nr:hypothetical protein [Parashewanella tropica]
MELKTFLLESIQGIIILGAIGSILGGFLVYLSKKSFTYLLIKINELAFAERMKHPLVRTVKAAAKLREAHAEQHASFDYQLYVSRKMMFATIDFIILICTLTLTLGTLIAFGIERPLVLSALLSVLILAFVSALKTSLHIVVLTSEKAEAIDNQIHAEIPKSYKEYKQLQVTTEDKA